MPRARAQRKSKIDFPMEYKMDHKQRGSAVIFNQENFKSLKKRCGTNVDRDKLTERFQALGFEVKAHNDKKKEEMLDELRKAASGDHADADCFVCIFLTHGEEGHIFAHDDKINMKEITDLFRGDNCKSLVGKPKIFIFQACAGNVADNAVTGMAGGEDSDDEEEEEAAMIYTIPAGADFLMCYSVVEGFSSFRHVEFGSFYVQELCKTLEEHGSTLEFTELLTLVSLKVSRRNINLRGQEMHKKQMPCFTSMLTQKLYFKPKK